MKKIIKTKPLPFKNGRFAVVLEEDLTNWIKENSAKMRLPAATFIRLQLIQAMEAKQ